VEFGGAGERTTGRRAAAEVRERARMAGSMTGWEGGDWKSESESAGEGERGRLRGERGREAGVSCLD